MLAKQSHMAPIRLGVAGLGRKELTSLDHLSFAWTEIHQRC